MKNFSVYTRKYFNIRYIYGLLYVYPGWYSEMRMKDEQQKKRTFVLRLIFEAVGQLINKHLDIFDYCLYTTHTK